MSEEASELLDPDLLRDAEATSQRPALAPALEDLKTSRLPPLTPPPPPIQFATSSVPPLPASFAPLPPSLAPLPAVPDMSPRPRPESVPAPARPSWLRSLLTATLPPATERDPQARQAAQRNAGLVCVAFAFVFAVLALVAGLRGAPDESMAPAVAAALVIAHAAIGVGAGAFSYGLLRMAERLLVTSHRD